MGKFNVKEFVALVTRMREAQRNWYTYHENRFLADSKRLEQQVDKCIEDINTPNLFDD